MFASFLKPENTVTLTVGRSEGDTSVYLSGGFRF